MSEDAIEAERRAKLARLKELGIPVYPSRFDRTHTVTEAVSELGPKSGEELEATPVEVQTAGRVISLRGFGKAAFAHITDGGARIQIYIRHDTVEPPGFDIYAQLDIGDFVGVRGPLFRTKTGELTVRVKKLTFLAKALLPLPEKWHGLTDVETRYRQRHLDLIANPETRGVFLTRSRLVREIRSFFDARGYLEVETPMLQPIAGGAVARPFKTFHNALGMEIYLRIAPELYLKRLTVGGFEKVYEINRNFRNEGISTKHNPEFTMLEFYEAYSDFEALMELTEELFVTLANRLKGGEEIVYGDDRVSFKRPWRRVRMAEAVSDALAGRDVQVSESDLCDREKLVSLLTGMGALSPSAARARASREASVGVGPHELIEGAGADPRAPWGKLLAELFEELVEPTLIQPTFVYDYPLDVSPLSKRKPDDPAFVERFELIIAGMECANGFSELNDADDQRGRFEAQLKAREQGDLEAHVMDEDYVRALAHGLPPTGGEGIGIDRLAMLFTDSHSIRDVILFPHLRPEAGRERSD